MSQNEPTEAQLDIAQLATLSRVTLPTEQILELEKDVNGILGFIATIQDVSLEEDDASTGMTHAETNVVREDSEAHEVGRYSEALIRALPERDCALMRVRKIL